jgi:UDPglucose 6-dehydrogenase
VNEEEVSASEGQAQALQKIEAARKVAAPFSGNLRSKTVAVVDLISSRIPTACAKPPQIPLITALQDMGAKVKAFDPVGMELARIEMPDIHYCEGPYEWAAGGRCIGYCHRLGTVAGAEP